VAEPEEETSKTKNIVIITVCVVVLILSIVACVIYNLNSKGSRKKKYEQTPNSKGNSQDNSDFNQNSRFTSANSKAGLISAG